MFTLDFSIVYFFFKNMNYCVQYVDCGEYKTRSLVTTECALLFLSDSPFQSFGGIEHTVSSSAFTHQLMYRVLQYLQVLIASLFYHLYSPLFFHFYFENVISRNQHITDTSFCVNFIKGLYFGSAI